MILATLPNVQQHGIFIVYQYAMVLNVRQCDILMGNRFAILLNVRQSGTNHTFKMTQRSEITEISADQLYSVTGSWAQLREEYSCEAQGKW
jgi:hypothetical protein